MTSAARPVPVTEGSYTAGGRNSRIPATQGMYCRATYGVLDTAEALYAPVNIEFDAGRYVVRLLLRDTMVGVPTSPATGAGVT